ncbi:hypothetical protein L6164_006675 [Bauhinia variegata]|uniref:Uncharacterized protein n=1 Tax=Bauhinia variegata TaxID=167791 RepID=A0ACB9PV58_BAUVA|nr:hypothetical protein L6164_006675 [Bauhinia variegata]
MMNLRLFCLLFLVLQGQFSFYVNSLSPPDDCAVNCGSMDKSNNRSWIADVNSELFSLVEPPNQQHSDIASTAQPYLKIPYGTARLSHSEFTYSFAVTGGEKCVRLYFYPASYHNLNRSDSFFSVSSGGNTPLPDFNASYAADNDSDPEKTVSEEFCVNVDSGQRLNVTFTPCQTHTGAYAFVNGIQVVSAVSDQRSLCSCWSTKRKTRLIVITMVSLSGLVLMFAIGFLILKQRIKKARVKAHMDNMDPEMLSSHKIKSSLRSAPCRYFSIDEIRIATVNFDDVFLIGVGGFGKVYKGFIDEGTTPVAIKRSNPKLGQGLSEFETEIEMLSQLSHPHLVSLIGYCNDDDEMILVYDFMANGTLRDHLYGSTNPPLSWKQRLESCIGAARGLVHLHRGGKNNIIHRDVKTSNILLDEQWVTKVSDFGLSKIGPSGESKTHITTLVRGSQGYLDPQYYKSQHLTEKSDVYSFGVVLLEVLCGRPPLLRAMEKTKSQGSLVEWARKCHIDGVIDQIVDPVLKGNIATECLSKFIDVALKCLTHDRHQRPPMSDVVEGLEYALQLQEGREDTKISSCHNEGTTDQSL